MCNVNKRLLGYYPKQQPITAYPKPALAVEGHAVDEVSIRQLGGVRGYDFQVDTVNGLCRRLIDRRICCFFFGAGSEEQNEGREKQERLPHGIWLKWESME